MKDKSSGKKILTIEGQLERYCLRKEHTERHEILWHAWCQNKRWISQLLEMNMNSFPTYSRHDETHASAVMHNIEMILGKERIKELSASDCFLILHTVYIHDIGMVITYEDREKIVRDENFIDLVESIDDENDPVIHRAILALKQNTYKYSDGMSQEEQMKRLYSDKLAVYYAILHMIANFHRTEHGERSKQRLVDWTLDSGKLGGGFSMAGIPQRIFLLVAKCAGLHTDSEFGHIMELPKEDNGYVSDYVHPRFVAVLLQLGDILDMDNDRFHPLTKECIGLLPELSERHYEKHQSIRKLYIRPDIISIEADCGSQDTLRLIRKECDMLKSILKEAGYNWARICPRGFSGSLPTVETVKLYLKGAEIPEELVNTQFRISQKKAFAILEGSNVYKEQYVFLREFVQNATDATKIQYWNDCVRMNTYSYTEEQLRVMSPEDISELLSPDSFPIKIEMQIAKCNGGKEITPLSSENIETFIQDSNIFCQYGVLVRIKDFGTGIDKESILNIANVGDSRKKSYGILKKMPEWLKPTAEFGVGLQSAFLLTNMFKCRTFTRSNEKYEITFSTVKSSFYEGYINVQPLEELEGKENSYGTCFEVFVPIQKKLKHESYPTAWDGADYFGDDYEKQRPIRHSAELLAQMALYLDGQIRDQLFPVHLDVKKPGCVKIPLNRTDKNQIKNIKYTVNGAPKENPSNTAGTYKRNLADLEKRCEWEGKLWLYYIKKLSDEAKRENGIIIERMSKSVAMLDGKHGHLYYWDNDLCVFCVLSMRNFLLRERRQLEDGEHYSEDDSQGVLVYYKGIFLARKEFPDLGNELFEYIDIKGKLERKYINLDRRGFTENGEEYFYKQIYWPLIEAVQKVLKAMNRNQYHAVVTIVRECFEETEKKIIALTEDIKKSHLNNEGNSIFEQLFSDVPQRTEEVDALKEERKRLLQDFKESAISIVMLGFFARKTEFSPILRLGCGNKQDESCCWDEITEMVGEACCNINRSIKEKRLRDKLWLSDTILFMIYHRPKLNLLSDVRDSNTSGLISFPDIISSRKQFMVVSIREDKSAPWYQFLTPIWEKTDSEKSLIDLLKWYSVMDNESDEKEKLRQKILDAGNRALKAVRRYMFNESDLDGGDNRLRPAEYLQQHLMKWLLRNIPTIALFMSEDGNTRINIIHEQNLPFVFVNFDTRKLIIERIFETYEKCGIQRYSIMAWQGLEYLSCKELPYSHFFIKRGYLSRDSYRKVIFPLDDIELREISKILYGEDVDGIYEKLKKLFNAMNILDYMKEVMKSYDVLYGRIKHHFPDKMDDAEFRRPLKEIEKDWEKINRTKEKIWGQLRSNYRSAISSYINSDYGSKEEGITIENLSSKFEDWEKFYLYILLVSISTNYDDGFPRMTMETFKSALSSLSRAWLYVIKGDYATENLKTLQYKRVKLSKLADEQSEDFKKQERILSYISKTGEGRIKVEYLRNCWHRYVEDIFNLIEILEKKRYKSLEILLIDKESIEKAIQRK